MTELEPAGIVTPGMPRDPNVQKLMEQLLKAIECSLEASEAARETVEEILKRGAQTSVFFVGADTRSEGPEPERFRLTAQDREFLRTLSIRPDSA